MENENTKSTKDSPSSTSSESDSDQDDKFYEKVETSLSAASSSSSSVSIESDKRLSSSSGKHKQKRRRKKDDETPVSGKPSLSLCTKSDGTESSDYTSSDNEKSGYDLHFDSDPDGFHTASPDDHSSGSRKSKKQKRSTPNIRKRRDSSGTKHRRTTKKHQREEKTNTTKPTKEHSNETNETNNKSALTVLVLVVACLALAYFCLTIYLNPKDTDQFTLLPLRSGGGAQNKIAKKCIRRKREDWAALIASTPSYGRSESNEWKDIYGSLRQHLFDMNLASVSAFDIMRPECVLTTRRNSGGVLTMINPKVIAYRTDESVAQEERSISCPEKKLFVVRSSRVLVQYLDEIDASPTLTLLEGNEAYYFQSSYAVLSGVSICDLTDDGIDGLYKEFLESEGKVIVLNNKKN